MKTDNPVCNFKNCKKCSDGNCASLEEYRKCEYALNKSMLNAFVGTDFWEVQDLPTAVGEYQVMIFDMWTQRTFRSQVLWNGKEFDLGNDNKVVAWLRPV